MSYVKYNHHGRNVWVREDLKGEHIGHCLCYKCDNFKPNCSDNCHIAQAVYENCVEFGLVTPVWECPNFSCKSGWKYRRTVKVNSNKFAALIRNRQNAELWAKYSVIANLISIDDYMSFSEIMTAYDYYLARFSNYEEKLSNAEITTGLEKLVAAGFIESQNNY